MVNPDDTAPAQPARWTDDQVVALAPGRIGPARAIAEPSTWSGLGGDDRALWGECGGSGREPYDVAVDHGAIQSQCSCPSRQRPCKHGLALLLLWAHGQVPAGDRPARLNRWLAANAARMQASAPAPAAQPNVPSACGAGDDGERPDAGDTGDRGELGDGGAGPGDGEVGEAGARNGDERDKPAGGDRDSTRAARVAAGLADLDRWLVDRMRSGLADPALGSYATWDAVAARLVDAQASALANRVRRIGAAVGTRPDWHDHVLAELGVLHLLARAGQRLGTLPPDLADGVAAAIGWQVRQADVLANTPETDSWFVAGRSDTLEDRIIVRRLWLHGESNGWAMLLSFAAYGQSLDEWPAVGATLVGDLHRYPGAVRLRALLGQTSAASVPGSDPPLSDPPLSDGPMSGPRASDPPMPGEDDAARSPAALVTGAPEGFGDSIHGACAAVGAALAAEPWLERYPIAVRASATRAHDRWVLTDCDGSLPLAPAATTDELAVLVAATAGGDAVVTAEWTSQGIVPLAVHAAGRSLDVGPRGGFTGPPARATAGGGPGGGGRNGRGRRW